MDILGSMHETVLAKNLAYRYLQPKVHVRLGSLSFVTQVPHMYKAYSNLQLSSMCD